MSKSQRRKKIAVSISVAPSFLSVIKRAGRNLGYANTSAFVVDCCVREMVRRAAK